MIDALSLINFMRLGKTEIQSAGNHLSDRCVFYYLVDTIDLKTGLAGSKHALSNGRIAADISERKLQGSRSEPMVFTRGTVRHSIERLCKSGLFDRLSQQGKGNNLLLRACIESAGLPMVDFSDQKKVAQKSHRSRTDNSQLNQGTYTNLETGSRTEVGINNSIPSFLPSAGGSVDPSAKLEMSITWQPSESFKKQISSDWSPDTEMLKQIKAATMGFKSYWSTRSDQMTQAQWESKLWKNELERLLIHGVSAVRNSHSVNAGSSQQATRSPRPAIGNPKLLKVPEKLFGRVLQDWAVNNTGFRMVGVGESDDRYKTALRVHIDKMNNTAEKAVMKRAN